MELFLKKQELILNCLDVDLVFRFEAAEIHVLREHGTTDDLCVLFEDAVTDTRNKKKNIFVRVFEKIRIVISDIIIKIVGLFNKNKNIKNDKTKIEIDCDLNEINNNIKNFVDKQNSLLNKVICGGKVDDDNFNNKSVIDKMKKSIIITTTVAAVGILIFKGKDILKYIQSKLDGMQNKVENVKFDGAVNNISVKNIIMDTSRAILEFTNVLDKQNKIIEKPKDKKDMIRYRRDIINSMENEHISDNEIKKKISEAEKLFGNTLYYEDEPVSAEYFYNHNKEKEGVDRAEAESIHITFFSKDIVTFALKHRQKGLIAMNNKNVQSGREDSHKKAMKDFDKK